MNFCKDCIYHTANVPEDFCSSPAYRKSPDPVTGIIKKTYCAVVRMDYKDKDCPGFVQKPEDWVSRGVYLKTVANNFQLERENNRLNRLKLDTHKKYQETKILWSLLIVGVLGLSICIWTVLPRG